MLARKHPSLTSFVPPSLKKRAWVRCKFFVHFRVCSWLNALDLLPLPWRGRRRRGWFSVYFNDSNHPVLPPMYSYCQQSFCGNPPLHRGEFCTGCAVWRIAKGGRPYGCGWCHSLHTYPVSRKNSDCHPFRLRKGIYRTIRSDFRIFSCISW